MTNLKYENVQTLLVSQSIHWWHLSRVHYPAQPGPQQESLLQCALLGTTASRPVVV